MKIALLSKNSDCGNQLALEFIRMKESAICIFKHFISGMFFKTENLKILRSEFFQRNRRQQDSSIIPVGIMIGVPLKNSAGLAYWHLAFQILW